MKVQNLNTRRPLTGSFCHTVCSSNLEGLSSTFFVLDRLEAFAKVLPGMKDSIKVLVSRDCLKENFYKTYLKQEIMQFFSSFEPVVILG